MSPLLPCSHRQNQKKTPKPHNKLLAQGASHRVCGRRVVVMWFSKAEPGRPDVPMRLRQSPAHVSSTSFILRNDTQLNVWGYERSNGDWIYGVEGRLCAGRRAEVVCLLSACGAAAKVKTSVLWCRVTSASWGQGQVSSHSLPELSPSPTPVVRQLSAALIWHDLWLQKTTYLFSAGLPAAL